MPRATDVETPIGDSPSASGHSTDQADAALNRRRRRHQRIITALKSLRFGCFLGMVAAAALCVICGSGIAKVLLKLPLLSWKGPSAAPCSCGRAESSSGPSRAMTATARATGS